MPFVSIAHNPAITGRKEGVFKNLFAGKDAKLTVLGDQQLSEFSRCLRSSMGTEHARNFQRQTANWPRWRNHRTYRRLR